jgi:hypothetical protein
VEHFYNVVFTDLAAAAAAEWSLAKVEQCAREEVAWVLGEGFEQRTRGPIGKVAFSAFAPMGASS